MTIKTLLIVDDSVTARLLIKAMFEELHPDWAYLQANNAKEALSILQNSNVDYFSIDYNMPGQSGLELIEEIRKQHKEHRAILLTANIQPQIVKKAESLNVLCLHKPLSDELIQQAEAYFSHE